jgi:aspartyl-tRNA(Asn)/glutamyl-tRNA(Gln) amidotransferase subunit B
MPFETVIGLEVHAQLLTESKAFCACPSAYGADPNAHTCPVCLGLPGALPVLNRQAVTCAIRLILAVNGRVEDTSIMARKNYFYPDLPKGYQISQYEAPLGSGGAIDFTDEGRVTSARLIRIHLEEDAGKSLHPDDTAPDPYTRLDLNRCGVPLLEIVSEPDIRSPRHASLYLHKLRQLVRYLQICTGNMEEGAFRCDANVSIRPRGADTLGTRTEIKNMNSFRSVERALEFEIARQSEVVRSGGAIERETLLWDDHAQTAAPMRSKEESSDYRYFPDPDLLPVRIGSEIVASVRDSLPELPDARAARFVSQYGLPAYDAQVLTDDRALAEYYERVAGRLSDAKAASNWIMTEVMRVLKESGTGIEGFPIGPDALSELLTLVETDKISGKIAKDVFAEMLSSGMPAGQIVESKGLSQISDHDELGVIIESLIQSHSEQVSDYRAGNKRVLGFFVGQVMQQTGGRANPAMVNELLRAQLDRI